MKTRLMLLVAALILLGAASSLWAQDAAQPTADGARSAVVTETVEQSREGGLKSKINEVFSIPMWPL